MKLVHPEIGSTIELSDQKINILVLEAPRLFCTLVSDIKKQVDNFEGEAVLSLCDKPVSFHKYAELITDPLSLEMNSRKLLTKVLSALEKCALEGVYYERTQQLSAQIEAYVNELSLHFDADLVCENITFQQILKAAGVAVADDYERLIDRVYAYMELVREFDGEKAFLFVNLGSYVTPEQMQEFADTVIGHSYRVLLIENRDSIRLTNANRLTIDCDLCEF